MFGRSTFREQSLEKSAHIDSFGRVRMDAFNPIHPVYYLHRLFETEHPLWLVIGMIGLEELRIR